MSNININEKSKLIFEYKDLQIEYNKEKENSLIEYASKKYNVPKDNIVLKFIPISYDNDGNRITLNSEIIENIQDPNFQFSLFEEYIKMKNINDVDLSDIKKIDNEINSYIDFDAYKNYKSYKIKYVKWDNFLSYGGGNFFDFTKLKGLTLLNGFPENQCGKTTFAIDLIRFALFGKSDKSPTLDSVFNEYLPNETNVVVEIMIEIEGIDYVIKRTITRPPLNKRTKKSKVNHSIEYYKVINGNNELIENCQDESVTKTNKLIKDSIGTVEDFNLVMSATSYSLNDLLKLGQSDKSRLFSKWLGLLTLEKKEEIAKKIYKENIVKTFKTQLFNSEQIIQEIEEYEENIKNSEDKIQSKEKEEINTKNLIQSLEHEKSIKLSSKKEINADIDKLDANTIEMSIKSLSKELDIKRNEFKCLKDKYISELKHVTFDKSEIDEKRKKRDSLKEDINSIKFKINFLKDKNKELEDLIDKKICPTCKQKIDSEKFNNDINDNKLQIKYLIENGIKLNEKLIEVDNDILKLEKNRELNELKNKYELKMTALKTNIDNIKLKLENEKDKEKKINENIENIKFNNQLNLDILNLEAKIHNETSIKESIIKDIQILRNNIEVMKKTIKDKENILAEIEKENKIKRNWAIYQLLIGKDGITKIVLNKALPIINNEMYRLLDGICDFNVSIEVIDGKLQMFLIHNDKKLDLSTRSSGFEGTMASLALRAALGNMSTMPKPNFIVLDEIINTVGNENLENIHKLFIRILNNYDFIIHITHMEQIYDWHDKIITITKNGDVSKISI